MTRLMYMLAAAAGLVTSTFAMAQLPAGPVTIVVPYSPGGSSDSTARLIAKGLSEQLHRPVIVENRPGAGGNIGAASVARAQPDGRTLLFAVSSHAANMALYKKPGYDLVKDFAPISLISTIPNVLVVPSDSPARTLQQYIDGARAATTPWTYGSAGSGTSSHLAATQFEKLGKLKLQHVPYKGGALANQDLLGGRLDAVFAPMVEVLPFVEAGKLRPLGVTSTTRSKRLPNVPAIAEALPGYKSVLWNGLMAPAGTPPSTVKELSTSVQTVLKDPKLRSLLESQGTVPVGGSSDDFAKMLPEEVKDWAKTVQYSNASLD